MNTPHKDDIYHDRKSRPLIKKRRVTRMPSETKGNTGAHENKGNPGHNAPSAPQRGIESWKKDHPPAAPRDTHHTSKRRHRKHRRRRSDSMPFPNKIVMALLLCVLIAYFALLGITMHKGREAAAARTEPASPVADTGIAEEETVSQAAPATPWAVAEQMAETIREWERAQNALNRAASHNNRDRIDHAVETLEKALEQLPSHLELQMALADIYKEQKRWDDAAELYWHILQADPHHNQARLKLATILAGQKQHDAVLKLSYWMLESDAYNEMPNHLIAQAYLALGHTEQALPYLRRLTTLNRENVVARNNLAVAYSRLGNYHQAVSLFNEVLKLDNRNSVTYYNLAVCHAQQLNAASAVATLSDAADAFGMAFVRAWTTSPDFDPIRDTEDFKRLEQYVATPEAEQTSKAPGSTPL